LLFRLGYALHRQGKELIIDGDPVQGAKHCKKAQEILERARTLDNSEERNHSLRNQILANDVRMANIVRRNGQLIRQLAT
jgi:hypothetical protein